MLREMLEVIKAGFVIASLYPSCMASAVSVGIKARMNKIPEEEALDELKERIEEKISNTRRKVEVIKERL